MLAGKVGNSWTKKTAFVTADQINRFKIGKLEAIPCKGKPAGLRIVERRGGVYLLVYGGYMLTFRPVSYSPHTGKRTIALFMLRLSAIRARVNA